MFTESAPDGISTDGLKLGSTTFKSGEAGALTTDYQLIGFTKTRFPSPFGANSSVAWIRIQAVEALSISGDGTNGDYPVAANTEIRLPASKPWYIKAANACAAKYILELAL